MTDRPVTAVPEGPQVPAIPARLEPDAIGVAQDTIIGLANVGPALYSRADAGRARRGGGLRRRRQ